MPVSCVVGGCTRNKVVQVFPNNKPWFTKELHNLIKRKRAAFTAGDRVLVKVIQRDIDKQVKQSKLVYKRRLEENFNGNNPRAAWQQMQPMTGYKESRRTVSNCSVDFANELNAFFCRFDTVDFSADNNSIGLSLQNMIRDSGDSLVVSALDVSKVFACAKIYRPRWYLK